MFSSLLRPKRIIIGVMLAVMAVAALGCGEEKEALVLKVSLTDVPSPAYNHFAASPHISMMANNLSICDSLMNTDYKTPLLPMLAKSWDVKGEGVTYKLREDVEFHRGFGKLTSADVLSSYNESRAEGSTFSAGQTTLIYFDDVSAPDDFTFHMSLTEPTIRWAGESMNWTHTVWVTSKKALDDNSREWQHENETCTGPFTVTKQLAGDTLELEAVPDHWRETARFEMVKLVHVPEEATRIAQLKTGQADIANISLGNVEQVENVAGMKFVTGRGGMSVLTVVPTGQYYIDTKEDGTPVDKSGGKRELHLDLPWIGDPSDPASMESARKVRWAMSMAIDRQAIVDTILGGQGCQSHTIIFDDCHPRFQQEWFYDYDPEKARQWLAEAGYPDGFEFRYGVVTAFPPEYEQIAEAMIPMWREVGIRPKVEIADFGDLLDAMSARTINDIVWIGPYGGNSDVIGNAINNIDFITDVGLYGALEWVRARELLRESTSKLDLEEAWKVQIEFQDWKRENMLMIPTVAWRPLWVAGPAVASWAPWGGGLGTYPEMLETAIPAAN